MYRLLITAIISIILVSCGKEQNNMTINGNIKGLRKGTLYFQKVEDSTLVTLDSVKIKGDSNFTFATSIESPEVFTLYLDKNDGNLLNDRLDFFGEPGTITIKTTRDYFAPEAKIEGSKSNDTWVEYKKIRSKFSGKNLDLIKDILQADKDGNAALADSLQQISKRNTTREYLYTINFVLNNKDSYAAPYIVLANAYNVNIKYLDSINNSLSSDVVNSKYGKMLNDYIEGLKSKSNVTVQDSIH